MQEVLLGVWRSASRYGEARGSATAWLPARVPGGGVMGFHRPDLHTLAGAHALHALEEADRERFEQHLARCETCVQALRGKREAKFGSAPPPRFGRVPDSRNRFSVRRH